MLLKTKMKSTQLTTIILLLVLMHIEAQKKISRCGQLGQNNVVSFVTNSFRTQHWPWHAAIYHRHRTNDELSPTYQCGGTVISSKSVLTAAHCVCIDNRRLDAKIVSVKLGRLNLGEIESSGQSFEVTEIIVHPYYSSIDYVNDIAIIRLSVEAAFNTYVQPICLWKSEKIDLSAVVGKFGTVVGWGKTEKGEVSSVLREASMPVVDLYMCLYSNRNVFGQLLSKTNFCAGIRNGTSVCTGDSGGSMSFKENGVYFIRGIVSVGPSKEDPITQAIECDSMQYALFTDVAQYLHWIKEETTYECETKVRCDWDVAKSCSIVLNVAHYAKKCKIIFDEVANTSITMLSISGESDVIPELSNAVAKFENLDGLSMENMNLEIVNRARLTPFRKLKTLNLSSNEITHIDDDTFADLKNLEILKLDSNNLNVLHADLFKELRNLEIIYLYENQLETLPAGIFRKNKKLREIRIWQNQIKELHPDVFEENQNLEHPNFYDNQLETLPEGIFRNNKKILKVTLSRNQLKELHVDVFATLYSLEIISLFENRIDFLPANIFANNKKMRVIGLNNNHLNDLHPNIFKKLYNLEEVFLYENRLEFLPADIFVNNKNIREIGLSQNQLKQLPSDLFKELHNLEILYLFENQLEALPADIFINNKKLQEIRLYNNRLRELHADHFRELYNLKELNLFDNRLETLASDIFVNNKKLRQLVLSKNNFKELPVDLFKGLLDLEKVFLYQNELEHLPADIFRNNKNLQRIILSQNRLTELQVDLFAELINLDCIALNENRIEILPRGLFRNNLKLKLIYLQQNKITKIESDLNNVPKIIELNLRKNVCIDEDCGITKKCDESSFKEIVGKIQSNC